MKITDENARDILITAVEGGIGYWSRVSNYLPTQGRVTVHEGLAGDPAGEFGDGVWNLTLEDIRRGFDLYGPTQHGGIPQGVAFEDWDYDSEDADAIVQLATLGEVVYG